MTTTLNRFVTRHLTVPIWTPSPIFDGISIHPRLLAKSTVFGIDADACAVYHPVRIIKDAAVLTIICRLLQRWGGM